MTKFLNTTLFLIKSIKKEYIIVASLCITLLYGVFVAGYVAHSFFQISQPAITVEKVQENDTINTTSQTASLQGGVTQTTHDALVAGNTTFVASNRGKVYYLPWCVKDGQISDQNKVIFQSRKDAETAGYTPAASCPEIALFSLAP